MNENSPGFSNYGKINVLISAVLCFHAFRPIVYKYFILRVVFFYILLSCQTMALNARISMNKRRGVWTSEHRFWVPGMDTGQSRVPPL